jgi:glycosyltransferase involved in cell wall biosynthesis
LARIIEVDEPLGLWDYADLAFLAPAVQELRTEASTLVPALRGRKLWMVNSTPQGGGVAEMLPMMVSMLRELGVETDWAVIETDRQPFFELTKRIHNMIHGVGGRELSSEDRELFESVGRENAEKLRAHVRPNDILVIHDPQPVVVGSILKREIGLPTIWCCHIGLPERLPATRAVWQFLEPYIASYDNAIFSAPDYIPSFLAGAASVIHPAIDPLSQKNRDLHTHGLAGILCNSALAPEHSPVLTPAFDLPAMRLMPDGSWAPPSRSDDIGMQSRPIVAQISRWDRLKGFAPLLDGFAQLKRRPQPQAGELHRRRLAILRLVLAGPDPASVADDPEGLELAQAERPDGERHPALRLLRGAELAPGGIRSDRHRGDVEAHPRRGHAGLRPASADPRRTGRTPGFRSHAARRDRQGSRRDAGRSRSARANGAQRAAPGLREVPDLHPAPTLAAHPRRNRLALTPRPGGRVRTRSRSEVKRRPPSISAWHCPSLG